MLKCHFENSETTFNKAPYGQIKRQYGRPTNIPMSRKLMPITIMWNSALKRKIPTNGSKRQMIKSVPVAANSTASAKYMYGINPSVLFNHFGRLIGFITTKSCMAPKGHAPAQKVRPKNNVNNSGKMKNNNAVKEMRYPVSKKVNVTF